MTMILQELFLMSITCHWLQIKDFNALIDNKPFFDQPVKSKQAYGKLVEMSRNNDNATGNVLDYSYH